MNMKNSVLLVALFWCGICPAAPGFLTNGVTAHRGNSGEYPECTMPAFRSALALGVDWIELDLFRSKDGKLVVIHDRSTGRVGDRNLEVVNSTYAELAEVDVATDFRKRHGRSPDECPRERIPLLRDVLELVMMQDRTRLSIQPKMDCVADAIALINEMGAQKWVGFNDGNLAFMSEVKRLAPAIPVFWDRGRSDLAKDIQIAQDRGFEALVLNSGVLNRRKVRLIQKAGLEAGVWTVNSEADLKRFLELGVDRVYTDFPARLLTLKGLNAPRKTHSRQPNFLIITADDMNWDSVGCYGSQLKGITPNLDRLAESGLRFTHAHVGSTACYPSRSAISTGRRGHRSGGEGFFYLRFPNIPTVQQLLHDNGYRVGILGKVKHSTPYEDTPWGLAKEMGRNTDEFEKETAAFIDEATQAARPFYLIVNSHDPHRPYFNAKARKNEPGTIPSRVYRPDEIPVHPTIPDTPAVREEQAAYFSSVRRCDDVVGRAIKVLEERGLTENTMIVFLSDHGMAVPSAKSNCYVQSTRTPFIMRWDGRIKAGQVDSNHIISTMDILPTILEAAKIKNPGGMDGRSLTSLFNGGTQPNRDHIFTQYYMKIGKPNYQMRALQNTEFCYVFNPWHNGKAVYNTSSMGGAIFTEMVQLGKRDPVWKARSEYLLRRVPEEFFDLHNDPHCLNNLINDPAHSQRIADHRRRMSAHLKTSVDPMAEVFESWLSSRSVEKMTATYAAMWPKYNLPGSIASNPVKRDKWERPEEYKKAQRAKRQK